MGAGSGQIGRLLRAAGWRHIDGHDGCQALLDTAQAARPPIYERTFCQLLTGEPDSRLPVADDTYDAALSAGAFLPGHIPDTAFGELIRVTRNGGYVIWTRGRAKNYANVSNAVSEDDFRREVDRLTAAGRWRPVDGFPRVLPDYYPAKEGLLNVMQVTKRV